jgi:hypothetical protein
MVMTMTRLSCILTTGIFLFAGLLPARADVYTVLFTGTDFTVNATVTTDPTNVFATSITGQVNSATIGTSAITALEPGSPSLLGPQGNDNALSATGQLVTNNGLAFDEGLFVYDLYSTGSGPFSYFLVADNLNPDASNFDPGDLGSLTVTDQGLSPGPTVPESSTWLMMILGFCGIGYMTCRRKRKTAFWPPAALGPC